MSTVPIQQNGGFLARLGGLFGGGLGGGGTPEEQLAEQRRAAIFQAGLATLANAQQPGATLGGSLFGGFQAGAQSLQNARKEQAQSAQAKRQQDREDRLQTQETAQLQLAQAEAGRKARTDAAGVASRVASGLSTSKDPLRQFQYLASVPEVQSALIAAQIDPSAITTPEALQGAMQQLAAFGQAGVSTPATASSALEAIVGPDGKPRLVPREQAVNQTPYFKPSAGVNINLGQPSGEERKAAVLATRLEGSLRGLADLSQSAPGADTPTIPEKVAGTFSETAANFLRTPARQEADTYQTDALDAALTLATGAAYTKEQLAGLRKVYFPQINDDERTKAAKAQKLQELVNAARIAAGRAEPMINQALEGGVQGGQLKKNADGSFTYTPIVP